MSELFVFYGLIKGAGDFLFTIQKRSWIRWTNTKIENNQKTVLKYVIIGVILMLRSKLASVPTV